MHNFRGAPPYILYVIVYLCIKKKVNNLFECIYDFIGKKQREKGKNGVSARCQKTTAAQGVKFNVGCCKIFQLRSVKSCYIKTVKMIKKTVDFWFPNPNASWSERLLLFYATIHLKGHSFNLCLQALLRPRSPRHCSPSRRNPIPLPTSIYRSKLSSPERKNNPSPKPPNFPSPEPDG